MLAYQAALGNSLMLLTCSGGNYGQYQTGIEKVSTDHWRSSWLKKVTWLEHCGSHKCARSRKVASQFSSKIAQQKARTERFRAARKILKQVIQIGNELVQENASKATILLGIAAD